VCSGSTDVGHGAHPNVSLIGQGFDLSEYLPPHRMAMVANQDQFERPGPFFDLLDFVRNRLLITHSLLCNRLGHPQLNLPNPGE
jgi:hypothetical protein